MTDRSRREFLQSAAIGVGASLLPSWNTGPLAAPSSGWDQVPEILKRVVQPVFPTRDFDIPGYGAVGDGVKDCSAAFAAAVEACRAAGGGRVTVPPGRYLSGPIHLKSGVNLHVENGATILFSTDPRKYLPQVLTGLSPLIYAIDCENIAVTGAGTLDGQASQENWWGWKGGRGEGSRPPSFIQFYRCRNVVVGRFSDRDGVNITRAPMWAIHPVLCTNVTVRRAHVSSPGADNDGCVAQSCTDVLIENCFFNTGNGGVAIKSGRNDDERQLHAASENVIVRGCELRDGREGVTIGSETSGGVRNVFVERCTIASPRLERALAIESNAARGGLIEHIYARDVTAGEPADAALSIGFTGQEGAPGNFAPAVRDIEALRLTSKKSNNGVVNRGLTRSTIDDVRVIDCSFDGVRQGNTIEHAASVRFENTRMNGEVVR